MSDTNETVSNVKPWYVKYKVPIGIGAVVCFIIGIIVYFSLSIGATNTGNQKQADLNAQYEANVGKLGDCIIRIREASGIAKGETAAFDKIIEDAVKGRYSSGSSAQPVGGAFFSAIKEAYPDIAAVGGTFNKVLEIANGCRTDYQSYQEKLLSMIASFSKWRDGTWSGRTFGSEFPSNGLHAKKGEETLTGKAALDQMSLVVTVSDARTGYDTGTITAEDPFGSTTTVKSGG